MCITKTVTINDKTKQSQKLKKCARHEDISAIIKVIVLWDVTPSCLVSQKPAALLCKIEIDTVQHV